MSKDGRSFSCSNCPQSTQLKRRCHEDRWDFTEQDDQTVFPIYITRSANGATGELYGFCPAKVGRDDPATVMILRLMMIAAETGVMLKAGALEDQPDWFVELLSWFLPKFDMLKFSTKAQMVLGTNSSQADRTKEVFSRQKNAR